MKVEAKCGPLKLMSNGLDPWLVSILACPRDHGSLVSNESFLTCAAGHRYPVIDGVPVMLLDELEQTIELARRSLEASNTTEVGDSFYVDTLGISEDEKKQLKKLIAAKSSQIDPVVSFLVAATNGIAYKLLIGKLQKYPIPEIPVENGNGQTLLDIGCSWGRWGFAAAQIGYKVVGIDPSLGAIMAARRVASDLGIGARFIVGDARYLPLKNETLDRAFSYSVLQHFSREDVAQAVSEIGRVLTSSGLTIIQFPTKLGLRCLYQQARRLFREPQGFEVRYWSRRELRNLLGTYIGRPNYKIDCFFGIGLQYGDRELYSPMAGTAVKLSELLKTCSVQIPILKVFADSIFVCSAKQTG